MESPGRLLRRSWIFVFGLLAAMASMAAAEAVYTYQGSPFTTLAPPYAAGDRVTGSFTLATRLPPLQAQIGIADLLTGFAFSDGVESYAPANTIVCSFEVATNAAGHITAWAIVLRREPFPAIGDPTSTLDSSTFGDLSGIGPATPGFCDPIVLTTTASSLVAGTWSDELPAGTPTAYAYTGEPFSTVTAPYTTSDRITGTALFADRLPAFLPPTDVRVGLESFSFSDGVATRTKANSEICAFTVATDGAGNITSWAVSVRQLGVAVGNPQHTIDVSIGGDVAGSGPAPAVPCDSIVLAAAASNTVPGTWDAGLPPASPTLYTYDGQPFTNVLPPYTTSDRVAGSITVAGVLPPFLSMNDISSTLVDFSFSDGVETRHAANTEVCTFIVSTDAIGQIVGWQVSLREVPVGAPGTPQHSINSGTFGDLAGTGPAGGDVCASFVPTFSGSNTDPGSWNGASLPFAPANYDYVGEPFDLAFSPYVVGQSIDGSIQLANRLPANLPLTDIALALLSFSFTDGLQTRDDSSSEVCAFSVATDGTGAIVQWQFTLRQSGQPVPGTVSGIDSSHFGNLGGDLGGSGPVSSTCGSTSFAPFGSSSVAGTWSLRGALAIPTLSPFALLLLAAALTLAARHTLIRRRMEP